MKPYLEGTRVGYEQRGNNSDEATGSFRVVRVRIALLWRDIRGIEKIDDPAFIFDEESVTEPLCQLTTNNGHIYVVGTYEDLLREWDKFLGQSSFATAFPAN